MSLYISILLIPNTKMYKIINCIEIKSCFNIILQEIFSFMLKFYQELNEKRDNFLLNIRYQYFTSIV